MEQVQNIRERGFEGRWNGECDGKVSKEGTWHETRGVLRAISEVF